MAKSFADLLRRTREQRAAEIAEQTTLDAPLPSPLRKLNVPIPQHGLRVAVMPDVQAAPGRPVDHLAEIGRAHV